MIVEGDAGDDLAADRNLRLHRLDRHWCVPFPGHGDDDAIEPRFGEHIAPRLIRAGEDLRRRPPRLGDLLEGAIEHELVDIAERRHFHIVTADELLQQHLPAHAGADDTQAQAAGGSRPGDRRKGRGGGDGGGGGQELATIHERLSGG